MERQRDLPVLDHAVDRRAPAGVDPGIADALAPRLFDNSRIMGVENDLAVTPNEFRFLGVRRFRDAVQVIKKRPHITDTAGTGLEAGRRLSGLDPGIAQQAFLGFARPPVVIDLLVGAARQAVAPGPAAVLVDQHHAVLLALIGGAARAGGDAGRIEAVIADARQVHHEGVAELQEHAARLRRHVGEVVVQLSGAVLVSAGGIVFPVHAVGEVDVLLARDHRLWPRHRLGVFR